MMIYEQTLNQSFRGTVLTAASECVSLNQQMVLQGQPIASLFGSVWHARICQKMILGYQGAIPVPSCGVTNLNTTNNQQFVEFIFTNHSVIMLLPVDFCLGMYFYSIHAHIQSFLFC